MRERLRYAYVRVKKVKVLWLSNVQPLVTALQSAYQRGEVLLGVRCVELLDVNLATNLMSEVKRRVWHTQMRLSAGFCSMVSRRSGKTNSGGSVSTSIGWVGLQNCGGMQFRYLTRARKEERKLINKMHSLSLYILTVFRN